MRHHKILSVIMSIVICVVCFFSVPIYISEDANEDYCIDLKDAVFHAQRADTGSNDHGLDIFMQTMETLAGLQNISAESPDSNHFVFLELCFLPTDSDFEFLPKIVKTMDESNVHFTSIPDLLSYKPPIIV